MRGLGLRDPEELPIAPVGEVHRRGPGLAARIRRCQHQIEVAVDDLLRDRRLPIFSLHRGSIPQSGDRLHAIEVQHLNCGTMCPRGARLLAGRGGLRGDDEDRRPLPADRVRRGELILVDTGFGLGDCSNPKRLGQPFRALVAPACDDASPRSARSKRSATIPRTSATSSPPTSTSITPEASATFPTLGPRLRRRAGRGAVALADGAHPLHQRAVGPQPHLGRARRGRRQLVRLREHPPPPPQRRRDRDDPAPGPHGGSFRRRDQHN